MFAVALALRAGYTWIAAGPQATPWSDPLTYDTVAWNLARGAGYSLGTGTATWPTAFVPPVVPWLTSLLYDLVGHRFFAALMLQCVIGATLPLLIASLASLTFGGSVARIAGWLAVFHPLLVFFSGYLLTETTFTALLLAALAASAAWLKTPRPGRALGVGLVWGIACLTRPTALALPALVALWAWRPLGLTVAPRDRIRQLALIALGVTLIVGPWTLRNAAVLGAFVPVTTGGGRAFLDSNNEVVWGDPATRGGANSTYGIEPWASRFRGHTEPEVDALARAEALRFLREHASEWPAMALAKLGRFWRLTAEGGGTGSWQREGSPLSAILARIDPLLLWSVLVLPLALFGFARSVSGPRGWYLALPALIIGYFTAVALAFWGSLRMRVPIEPLVVLYAAAGADEVRRRWLSRARGFRVIEGRR